MDDLRWILAGVGVVVVVAIYLSSRFEKEEWKREREGGIDQPKPTQPKKAEPQFKAESQAKKQAAEPQKPAIKKTSIGLSSEADVKEALDETEADTSLNEKKTEVPGSDWENVRDSAREPLIEDEIVSVEIPPELADFGKEPEVETKLKFKPEIEDPVQQELVLDVDPLVLVLSVLARDENKFSGSDLKSALEAEGLKHGDMDIFHYHMTGKKDAVFSVASVVEPGTFDLETIDEYATPGLSLFCQLPSSMAGADAFGLLLKKAQNIADKLEGQLCDDKRNLLSEQATAHYRDRITAFEHELVLARKKQE